MIGLPRSAAAAPKARHLLLVCPYFPPCAASGSFRMLGFARHLPSFGWNVTVVCGDRLQSEPMDPRLAIEKLAGVAVHKVPHPDGWLGRLNNRLEHSLRVVQQHEIWVARAWRKCRQLTQVERFDAVLTSGPPHAVHEIGRRMRSIHAAPWAMDLRDPWLNVRRRLGILRPRFARRRDVSISDASLILANAPQAASLLVDQYPIAAGKTVVLPNGHDDIVAPPRPPRAGTPITIVHAGELYSTRDPRPFFDALLQLPAAVLAIDNLRVTFFGRDRWAPCNVAHEIKSRGLESVVHATGQISYNEAKRAMQDASILLLLDEPNRRAGVPAKAYEYIAAGRPILALAEQGSDTEWALREGGAVYRLANPRDSQSIASAIQELRSERQTSRRQSWEAPNRSRFLRQRIAGELAIHLSNLVVPRTRQAYMKIKPASAQ